MLFLGRGTDKNVPLVVAPLVFGEIDKIFCLI